MGSLTSVEVRSDAALGNEEKGEEDEVVDVGPRYNFHDHVAEMPRSNGSVNLADEYMKGDGGMIMAYWGHSNFYWETDILSIRYKNGAIAKEADNPPKRRRYRTKTTPGKATHPKPIKGK